MTNKRVQVRRDTAANIAAATPASGEFAYATDTKTTSIGDGSTAGGNALAKDGAVVHIAGAETVTGKKTFTDFAKFQRLLEKVNVVAAAPSSTQNFDVLTSSIYKFTTNAANNWTLNVRGDGSNTLNSLMANDEALTIVVIAVNGGTPYRHTALTIDGNAVTPQWLGAAAPAAGTASKRDTYTFTIIKTGTNAFDVHASFASGN